MYRKLMRFRIIKDDRVFDAYLDERLSFSDNFKLLVHISDFDLDGFKVFDPNKRIFLNENIPIEEFNINSYMMCYLF